MKLLVIIIILLISTVAYGKYISFHRKGWTIVEPRKIGQRINCLTCTVDFLTSTFDPENICYDPSKNSTLTRIDLITSCPLTSGSCVTEVFRIHGVLASIERRCGHSYCLEACIQRGFGAEREMCHYCCEGVLDNNFTEEQISNYTCP